MSPNDDIDDSLALGKLSESIELNTVCFVVLLFCCFIVCLYMCVCHKKKKEKEKEVSFHTEFVWACLNCFSSDRILSSCRVQTFLKRLTSNAVACLSSSAVDVIISTICFCFTYIQSREIKGHGT